MNSFFSNMEVHVDVFEPKLNLRKRTFAEQYYFYWDKS